MTGKSARELRDALIAAYERRIDDMAADLMYAGRDTAPEPTLEETSQLILATLRDVEMSSEEKCTLLRDEWCRVMGRREEDLVRHLYKNGNGAEELGLALLDELANVLARETVARAAISRARMVSKIVHLERVAATRGDSESLARLEEVRQDLDLPQRTSRG